MQELTTEEKIPQTKLITSNLLTTTITKHLRETDIPSSPHVILIIENMSNTQLIKEVQKLNYPLIK